MAMKVCPVCEMEEDDSALTCSMCGSDFEPSVKEAPQQESPVDVPEDISSDIAEDDSYLEIRFSEDMFTDATAEGAVEPSDFEILLLNF